MAIDALAGAETESVRTHEQGLFSVLFAGFCGKGQTVVDAVSAAPAWRLHLHRDTLYRDTLSISSSKEPNSEEWSGRVYRDRPTASNSFRQAVRLDPCRLKALQTKHYRHRWPHPQVGVTTPNVKNSAD